MVNNGECVFPKRTRVPQDIVPWQMWWDEPEVRSRTVFVKVDEASSTLKKFFNSETCDCQALVFCCFFYHAAVR